MRQILPFAAFLAALTPAAHAFDRAECGEIESQIFTMLDAEFGWDVTQSPVSQAAAFEQGCVSTQLDVYVEDLGLHYRIGEASMVGPELMDWVRGDVILPARFALQLEDIALAPGQTVPEELAWLTDVTAESITLDSSWIEAEQILRIAPLRINLGGGNEVSVALEGQAAGWQPYVMRAADFGTTRLDLDIGFNGMFEEVIAPPIEANGNDLSPASMAFFAAMADGLMANAPASLLTPDARAEIVEFLRTLPTPRGDLDLSLTNDRPFVPEQVFHDLRTGIPFDVAVPDSLNIDADWSPSR